MTKAQILALVAAVAGVSVSATTAVFKAGGADKESVLLVHALRVEQALIFEPDGGDPKPGAEAITAWRTRAVPDSDGGVDFEDVGASACKADTALLRAWAAKCEGSLDVDGKSEIFTLENVYVVEVLPDFDPKKARVDVYGTNGRGSCRFDKGAELTDFLAALTCAPIRPRVAVKPL